MKSFWLLILFFSFLLKLSANSSIQIAESYLEKGVSLTEKSMYDDAVKILNKAMGLLREFPSRHPLRLEIERQLRITKGKSIVSRYNKRSSNIEVSDFLALKDENRSFSVEQVFGKISSRQIWMPRQNLELNHPVGYGRRVTVYPNSGIELASSSPHNLILRSMGASTMDLVGPNKINLYSGYLLMGIYKNNFEMFLEAPQTNLSVSSKSPFSCMFEVTTNGGFKVIALLGEIRLKCGSSEMQVLPGDLCFVLPDKSLSRKMSIELSTLMVTSKLITAFSKPLPFVNKLKQQAMMQALRTRKRYRTVVGDVKSTSDFEIRVLDQPEP